MGAAICASVVLLLLLPNPNGHCPLALLLSWQKEIAKEWEISAEKEVVVEARQSKSLCAILCTCTPLLSALQWRECLAITVVCRVYT